MLFCGTLLLNYATLHAVLELTAILQANFLPRSCPPMALFCVLLLRSSLTSKFSEENKEKEGGGSLPQARDLLICGFIFKKHVSRGPARKLL